MTTIARIDFKSPGFEKVLRSEGVHGFCRKQAEGIAAAANTNGECDGFVVESARSGTRSRAKVVTSDYRSRRAEAVHKALTNAIGAA